MKAASKREVPRRLLAGICTCGAAIVEPVSAQVYFAETQMAIVNDGLSTLLAETCDTTNLREAQEGGTIVDSNAANDKVRWTDQNCRGIDPRESYTLDGYLFSIASAPEAVSQAADPSGNRMQPLVAAPTAEGSTPKCTADGEWCIAIEAEEPDAMAVVRARRSPPEFVKLLFNIRC